MWYQLIRMIPQKMRMVEVMSRKTLLMLRNLWYFEDREPQVPRDIILAPETNGIFLAFFCKIEPILLFRPHEIISHVTRILYPEHIARNFKPEFPFEMSSLQEVGLSRPVAVS